MPLTQTQYDAIMRTFDEKQTKNRHIMEYRTQLIYDKLPEYKELEQSVSSLSVAYGKSYINGDADALNKLKQTLRDITEKKKTVLIEAGYDADFLAPLYDCMDCQDTGYHNGTKCHCFRAMEISVLYEQSNIQEIIDKENFSTLSYEFYQNEDLARFQNAVQYSQTFISNFQKIYQNLFFYGTVGTGKSFLSGCIAKELLETGHSVIYFSANGLFELLARFSFDLKLKESLYNFNKDLYNCDLVIIDDLGTEVTNAFVNSQVFTLINERHIRNKSTIISTNLNLEELRDRYSDRVFSRITSNYTLCKLSGQDIRMYKKRMANRK